MYQLPLVLHIIWNVFLISISAQKLSGPYYTSNEGFFPRTYNSKILSYVTRIQPMPKNYEDKRIYGDFLFRKTIRNLKGSLEVFKESNHQWQIRGKPVYFENICKMSYNIDTIKNCFNGKFVENPTCTLEAGNYTVKNLTFEDDLRSTVGQNMFYGLYRFLVNITGVVDGAKNNSTIQFDVRTWIHESTPKQSNPSPGPSKNPRPNHGNPNKSKTKAG